MSRYLNTRDSLIKYKRLVNSEYFVDKSMIIEDLNKCIDTDNNYICITRPRRFGKSSIINMLGAYYSKGVNSKEIFDKLKVSNIDSYNNNLNKHNVININFSELPDVSDSYENYIDMIKNTLERDIKELYLNTKDTEYENISRLLEDTGDSFIFIIDEWDYIFNRGLFKENQEEFLEFLRNLLKDKSYVSLVYMTGILPIKKYSTGSALNMFQEYTFLKDRVFEEYFGFTEEEVKVLCEKNNNIKYQELEKWYNGYMTATGIKVYNPRSVNIALTNNYCESYWTNTGAMDEVLKYLKYNILDVREDVIKMVDGEEIRINIREEFRAGQDAPKTKAEIYSAMIVLGFLSYYNNRLRIPNKELMFEFEKAISNESFGEVAEIISSSEKMLEATVNGRAEIVSEILHQIHNKELPILKYNDENSLSCVITLAYLSARDTYRIEREEKSGKGYVDFAFHPRYEGDTPFIIELKKDEDVDVALNQIKDKEYIEKFRAYNTDVLAVAICYDSKKKEHSCKIEKI